MKNGLKVFAVGTLVLSSCTNLHRPIDVAELTNDNLSRAENIRVNETVFSQSLVCFGEYLKAELPESLIESLSDRFAGISPIRDKTGRVYPATSTAVSDMVAHALAKTGLIRVIDIVDSQEDRINDFTTFSKIDSKSKTVLESTPQLIPAIPKGFLYQPFFHFAGAITEFNERESTNLDAEIKFFGFDYNSNVIDVALDLRIISSSDGSIGISDRGPNTISVANRLIFVGTEFDYFRIINDDAYRGQFAYQIGDPRFYAVRELAEYATLELLSNLFSLDWQDNCRIDPASMEGVFQLRGKTLGKEG